MEATTQETAVTDTLATNRTGGPQDRRTGQFKMPNWTIRFPQRHQQFLVTSMSKGCPRTELLLADQGATRNRQG
jgi:hypothetical protein